MIMVGPVAVLPDLPGAGFGKALVTASLTAIDPRAPLPQVMIGDADYCGRFFGFSAASTAGWKLPGPWEPARLLCRTANSAVLPPRACSALGAADLIWHRNPVPYVPPRTSPPSHSPNWPRRWRRAACLRSTPGARQTPGESHMRITADGTWFHEGGRINRPAMVRAFSALLTRDAAGQHWLVTPSKSSASKWKTPPSSRPTWRCARTPKAARSSPFASNTDDVVIAGPDHPLRAAGSAETPACYLAVRHGTEARLNRSTYGQLIDHALSVSSPEALSARSMGARFSLLPA